MDTNRLLTLEAEIHGPSTCHCFAGLCATEIPVKLGASVIGYLKVGQVFSRTPTERQFEAILGVIGRKTLGKGTKAKLKMAFMQTRLVKLRRYQSRITLLENFAEQLNQHAESLAIIEDGSERAVIAKARISKVASLVGYQSLSQFNRSFSRIVGSSPTLYRRESLECAAS